jgi:radical SAM protein with 4Fe4S-binding SPASM domain
MNQNTFCSLPFTEIFLGPNGDVKPCCSASISLGNLNENPIQEILQNHRSQDLRQAIINGEWGQGCVQCQRQAEQGVASERLDDLDNFVKAYGNVTNEFFKLKRLDLRWSNTCNLSCTYCYEYFSSKWAEIKGIKINNIKDENENSLMLLIEQHKDSVENVMLLGGEPLLQKQNFNLTEMLTGKNFYILSNLAVQLENNKVAQKLLKEPALQFGVSFETVNDRYEYVRHGANWTTFNSNLDYIHKLRPDMNIDAHSLYSIYSAFNLVEFYQYITDKNMFKSVFWNLLESSGENHHASVFKLTPQLKQLAVEELDRCIALFPDAPGIDNLKPIKQSLIDSMHNTMTKNMSFITEASVVESKLKKAPGKHFSDLWPELYAGLIR